VIVVADMWAGSYVGNWFKIRLTLVETGLMRLSRVLMWELLPWLLMTKLTPWEIWIVPPSGVIYFGLWIVIRSGLCCIQIFRIHLSLVDETLLKQMVESMTIGTTWINHWCWVNLVESMAVLASSSIVLFLPRQL